MNVIADLKQEVKESHDLGLLEVYLGGLVGQRCWKAKLGYGDELKLHFGDPQPIKYPNLPDLQRGAFVLNVRASAWRANVNPVGILLDAGYVNVSDPTKVATPGEMLIAANKLAGLAVIAVRTTSWFNSKDLAPGIQLVFTEGSVFELAPLPSFDQVEGEEIADWELFTPFQTYLRVGPGAVWSNLRSDVSAARNSVTLAPAHP